MIGNSDDDERKREDYDDQRSYTKQDRWSFGSEIPERVRYQNEGSSLTIDLPPRWHIIKYSRIDLCIVASCDSSDKGYSFVDWTCNFIDSDCEFPEEICNLESSHYKIKFEEPNSDHVFHKHSPLFEDVDSLSSMYSSCQKVRFQFSPRKDCCKVKKCGVSLVLGIQRRKHREEGQEEDSQKRIKQQNTVHEVTSSLTRPITFEDVSYENNDPDVRRLWPSKELKFRRLVFQRTQGLIQSTSSKSIMVIWLVLIIWGLYLGLS